MEMNHSCRRWIYSGGTVQVSFIGVTKVDTPCKHKWLIHLVNTNGLHYRILTSGRHSAEITSFFPHTLTFLSCRQNLYNNIIKEVFNSMTRIMGWSFIALVSK